MFGVGTFLSGLCLTTIGIIASIKEENETERTNEEYNKSGYSFLIQSEYDNKWGKYLNTFDMDAIQEDIKKDYPKMNDITAFELSGVIAAKILMEEETNYTYKVPERFESIYIEKYNKKEFRLKKGECND